LFALHRRRRHGVAKSGSVFCEQIISHVNMVGSARRSNYSEANFAPCTTPRHEKMHQPHSGDIIGLIEDIIDEKKEERQHNLNFNS